MRSNGLRTTLTLDPDVADALRAATTRTGKSLKQVVNDSIRAGLQEISARKPKPFRTKPFNTKLRPGISIDNVGELLAQVEGEDYK